MTPRRVNSRHGACVASPDFVQLAHQRIAEALVVGRTLKFSLLGFDQKCAQGSWAHVNHLVNHVLREAFAQDVAHAFGRVGLQVGKLAPGEAELIQQVNQDVENGFEIVSTRLISSPANV